MNKTQTINEAFIRAILENNSRDEAIRLIARAMATRDQMISDLQKK